MYKIRNWKYKVKTKKKKEENERRKRSKTIMCTAERRSVSYKSYNILNVMFLSTMRVTTTRHLQRATSNNDCRNWYRKKKITKRESDVVETNTRGTGKRRADRIFFEIQNIVITRTPSGCFIVIIIFWSTDNYYYYYEIRRHLNGPYIYFMCSCRLTKKERGRRTERRWRSPSRSICPCNGNTISTRIMRATMFT